MEGYLTEKLSEPLITTQERKYNIQSRFGRNYDKFC